MIDRIASAPLEILVFFRTNLRLGLFMKAKATHSQTRPLAVDTTGRDAAGSLDEADDAAVDEAATRLLDRIMADLTIEEAEMRRLLQRYGLPT